MYVGIGDNGFYMEAKQFIRQVTTAQSELSRSS